MTAKRTTTKAARRDADAAMQSILPRGGWRIRAVFGFLVVLGTLLVLRLADHQVLRNHKFLEKQGEARTVRTERIQAHRGMITDRNGEPLAVSTPVVTLWANPKEMGQDVDNWRAVGRIMSWSEQELREKMAQYGNKEFMYLRRQISPAEAEAVLAQGVDGVYGQREYKRFYPAGDVVANVVGFTNIDDQGQEGVELAFNDALTGTAGKRRVIKDLKGRVVKDLGLQRPEQNGVDIALSIDLRLQYFAHTILKKTVETFKAQGGSVVLLDTKTGEVLAMVNWPSYNPNNRIGIKPTQMRNRAMIDVFEPGSTMKPITMAAALESGQWKPAMVIDTNPGSIVVQGKVLKDHRNYGVIDLTGVIQKSSQVGTSRIALSLDPNFVRGVFHQFGLGQATGIGFPGESTGVLPSYQRWRDIDRVTMAFGYGVSVTTLQLANVYSIFANHGIKMPLSLLRRDKDLSGERVLPDNVAREIIPMLESVTQAGGTATRAQVPGFRVGGKTGTAHKLDGRGYSPNRYVAVFAGVAPVSDPRYAMAVMIDEPSNGQYYGGEAAAPVFSQLMQGVLQLMGAVPDAAPSTNTKPQTAEKNKSNADQLVVKGASA